MTEQNLLWKPSKNQTEFVSFHLPFIQFEQEFIINNVSHTFSKFACHCFVNDEYKIAIVPRVIASEFEKYASNKGLKPDAIVEGFVFHECPRGRSPVTFKYHIRCTNSRTSFVKFKIDILKKINSIKKVVVNTGKKNDSANKKLVSRV